MAKAVEEAGADGLTMINTLLGMNIDYNELQNLFWLIGLVGYLDQQLSL